MFTLIKAQRQSQLEEAVFRQIGESLARIRSGRPEEKTKRAVLIVPAQFTLKAEEMALKALKSEGFTDFHIMSGARLYEQIQRETGRPQLAPINTLGRDMLLKKIIRDHKDELKCFKNLDASEGFLQLAGDFIVQMKQNGFLPQDIPSILHDIDRSSILFDKLSDMQLIYADYFSIMEGKYTDSQDLIKFVSAKAYTCDFIKSSEIFYLGFYSFTKCEFDFLNALMLNAAGLTIALPCGDDEEIYLSPERTARTLVQMAKENGQSLRTVQCEAPKKSPPYRIVRCATSFTQAETVAAKIIELLYTKKTEPDRIAVITGNDDKLAPLSRVLTSLGVPVFADIKRSVSHTPAAMGTDALLDIAEKGVRRENMMVLLKSDILGIGDTQLTEKYIRKYHLSKDAFFKSIKYGQKDFSEEEFAEIERQRKSAAELVEPFIRAIVNAKSVKKKTIVLYDFLSETLRMPQRLERLAAELAEDGRTDEAQIISQSWGAICDICEQAVELLGSEEMDCAEFHRVFSDALHSIKIGVLPQSAGRVQLGTISRSKLSDIQYLFVADFNDGCIPSGSAHDALISDPEIQLLEEKGYSVAKPGHVFAAEERLNIETALTQDTTETCLLFAAADDRGTPLSISPLLAEIMRTRGTDAEQDVENTDDPLPLLTGKQNTQRHLALQFSSHKDSPLWQAAYNAQMQSNAAENIRRGLSYTPQKAPVPDSTVKKIYPAYFSPSQLETYAKCPFMYFVRYGLRAQEERPFEVDQRIVGNIHHEVLLRLSKYLSDNDLWASISYDELRKQTEEAADEVMNSPENEVVFKDASSEYRGKRIKKVCLDFAKILVDHQRKTNSKMMRFETPISKLTGSIEIKGRIDRIDRFDENISIIDYKTGRIGYDRQKIEDGKALQLMIYMESALQEQGTKPCGIYYFKISDALSEADFASLTDKAGDVILKNTKIDGETFKSEEDYEKLRSVFDEKLRLLIKDLTGGRIQDEPSMQDGGRTVCDTCQYHSICLNAM